MVTYYFGARRAEREILRTKLESLYVDLSKAMRAIYSSSAKSVIFVRGFELGYRTYSEVFEIEDAFDIDVDRYTSVISIYFPAAVKSFGEYWAAYQNINSIRFDVQISSDGVEAKGQHRHHDMDVALTKLSMLGKKLHVALLYEAAKINTPIWRRFRFKANSIPNL